jgi:hypothetical protein
MTLMRRGIGLLLAGLVCLPTLASAQENQKAYWTLGRTAAASVKLYQNSTYTTTTIRMTVCFDHYSASANEPAPTVTVDQDPPVQQHVKVDLGGCSSASYLVEGDSTLTLTASSLAKGAIASGSYQITTP